MAESPGRPAIAGYDAVRYSWHKAKSFYSLYVFALGLMFIIRTAQKDTFSLAVTLKELFHFKWEFLMLQMLGFNHNPTFDIDYLMGPDWFISRSSPSGRRQCPSRIQS